MTDIITNIIDDKQDIKNQLGSLPNTLKVPFRFTEDVEPAYLAAKYERVDLSGSMIWGASSAIWGTIEWGGVSGSSMILGSNFFGYLNLNVLGAGSLATSTYAVIPANNIFVEYFNQDMFIDTTASTGTLNTTAGTYTLAPGQILQSTVIAKLRTPITRVTGVPNASLRDLGGGASVILPFSLGVDTFIADNAEIYVSNDSGVTWHAVNEGNTFTFPSSTVNDELKYKIVANTAVTISDPLIILVNQ